MEPGTPRQPSLTGEPWGSRGHDPGAAPSLLLSLIPTPPQLVGVSPHTHSSRTGENLGKVPEDSADITSAIRAAARAGGAALEGTVRAEQSSRSRGGCCLWVPSENGNGEPGTPAGLHPHQLPDTEQLS